MPTISESASAYYAYKAATCAPGTVNNCQQALSSLVAVVGDMQCESLEPEHFDKWWMKRLSQVAPATSNRDLSSVRVWVTWAQRYGHLRSGVAYLAGVRRVTQMPKDRLRVPVEKFPALLDAALDPVARMVIALGLYVFPRQSEIKTIRHGDVDLARGSIHVRVWKTRKINDAPICSELDAELRRYLSWRAAQAPIHPSPPLIPARGGGQWVAGRDRRSPIVLQVDKPMGKPYESVQWALGGIGCAHLKGEGCHTLRRSGARALYDSLCDRGHDRAIRVVQCMLNHSSIAMTEHYIGISADEVTTARLLRGKPMFGLEADNVIRFKPQEPMEETWLAAL